MTSSFHCKSDPKYLVGEGGITSEKKMEKKILCMFPDEKKFVYVLSQVIMNQ